MLVKIPGCVFCGENNPSMELDDEKVQRWKSGEAILDVWPEMSLDDAELLVSGTHPKCFTAMFGEEDEEEF